jgi:hypothetical protein
MAERPDLTADSLILAARAWEALRQHAGADEGSDESQQIARDVMSILIGRSAHITRPAVACVNTMVS